MDFWKQTNKMKFRANLFEFCEEKKNFVNKIKAKLRQNSGISVSSLLTKAPYKFQIHVHQYFVQ